jgi:hypothetical protein
MFLSVTFVAIGVAASRFGIHYLNDLNEQISAMNPYEVNAALDAAWWRSCVPMASFVCAGAAFGAAIGLLTRRKLLCTILGVLIAFVAAIVWGLLIIWLTLPATPRGA